MPVSFSDINLLKQLSCKIYCCLASADALEVGSKYLNEVLYYYHNNNHYSERGTENEREGGGGRFRICQAHTGLDDYQLLCVESH